MCRSRKDVRSHSVPFKGGRLSPSDCIIYGRDPRPGVVRYTTLRPQKIPPCSVRSRSRTMTVSGCGCAARSGSRHNRRRRRKCCVTHYTLQARWWARGLPSGLPFGRRHPSSLSGKAQNHMVPCLTERTPMSCFAFFAVLSPTPAVLSLSMISRWGFGPSERS